MMGFLIAANARAQLLKNVANKAKQKIEQKTDQKVDKSIDDAMDGKSKTKTETPEGEVKVKKEGDETKIKTEGEVKPEGLKAYSKYDFVPGEKIVAYEDFSRVNVGDFPTSWNTNGSGEVVTLNKKEGKWLKVDKEGYFLPEMITTLPENSTLEFDLGVNEDFSRYNHTMHVYIVKLEDREGFSDSRNWYKNHNIKLELHPNRDPSSNSGRMWISTGILGNSQISNEAPMKQFDVKGKNFGHVSLWRQGQRLRAYVNGEKIFDLPRAFAANAEYNSVIFYAPGFYNQANDYYRLGNIRLATGAPDTRNKLITEGKFVTTGIGFDVNSDRIKPDSYGVLKEIANALTENPSVKISIIGHTDSDGDDKSNLDLSKRRAAAVKSTLATDFGIDASRMETDGMGESKPVGDNSKPEGKAQNRRVEFIKR